MIEYGIFSKDGTRCPRKAPANSRLPRLWGTGRGAASKAVVPEFVSLRRKRPESRMLEIGTSGLMSGDGKRVGGCMSVPAPILDATRWLAPWPARSAPARASQTKIGEMKQFILLTLASTLPILLAAEPKTADAVKAADKRWASATVKDDKITLNKLLADDLVYTHSTGDKDGKAAFIENLSNGVRKYTKIDQEQMTVRLYGNTAVLDGDIQIITDQKGVVGPAHLHIIHVWVYKAGRWQLVAHQSLRLAK